MNGFAMFLVPGIWEAVVIFCIIRSNITLDRGAGWGGVEWDNNVIGTSTHMWCYTAAHIRHATLLYVLSHLHAYVMLRYCRFSCTCTHNWVMMMIMTMMLMIKKMTDRQTASQPARQPARQAGGQAGGQAGRQTDRQTGWRWCCCCCWWWWWSSRWQTWCWWWRWWWWWWWWRWRCCWCWD